MQDGHPERNHKYKPPAKLQCNNPYENFSMRSAAPSRQKFSKQDAREMEELLGDSDQTYAPSVARMKRRCVHWQPSLSAPKSGLWYVMIWL